MNKTDKRGRLKEKPFRFQSVKDQKVLIYCENRLVKTLSGKHSERFLRKIVGMEDPEIQLALAKVTGNFKHGNES